MNANSDNGNMSRPNSSGKVDSNIKGPLPMRWLHKTGKLNLAEPQGKPISKKGTAGK
jgi:hypothetical protein